MTATIKCIAIDDEPIALEKMKAYISKVPFLQLVALCESPFEAMQVMAEESVDAVFVDINMPDLNGMDFIASLQEQPMVVFTTAYAEYAVESYKVSAVDYLLKPFDFASFQRAANKLQRRHELLMASQTASSPDKSDTLYVKVDYRYVSIQTSDIMYIKGMSEYVQIFLEGRKPLIALLTMRQAMDHLPPHFLQVHRSYIVNMKRVVEVERLRLRFSDGALVAVGDKYKDAFLAYLRDRALEKT